MVKISRKVLFTIFLALMLLTPFVLGKDFLDPVFSNFRGTDLGGTYVKYAPFIDAILYIWLFIALTKGILKDKLGTQVAYVMGVILGISMCVFELNSKFNIGKLGPFAALIFFLVFGKFLYDLVKKYTGNDTWAAVSIAFLVIYSLAEWAAPALIQWINQVEWLSTILSMFYLVSVIGLVYGVIKLFGNIKSGEWKLRRAGAEETAEETKLRNKERKDALALRREKKAAENMFKLETEMGNINQSIQQLEDLEVNINNRELKDRKEQVRTLGELENVIQGSWRLQQQLQEAYRKASQPEYANNAEFIKSIKDSAQQLDGFVTRIRTLLTTLHTKIQETKSSYESSTVQLNTRFDSALNDKQNQFKQQINAENDIRQFIQQLNGLDIRDQKFEDDSVKKLNEHVAERGALMQNITKTQNQLKQAQKEIHDLDSKHLDELSKAMNVAEKNPAQDLGKLQRTLNIAQNTKNIKSDFNTGFGPPGGGIASLAGGIAGVINLGFKYLSGNSLREMFESVKTVHLGIQRINTELLPLEQQSIEGRDKLLQQYGSIERDDFTQLRDSMAQQMKNIQGSFSQNLDVMKEISRSVLGVIDNVKQLKDIYHKDRSDRTGPLLTVLNVNKESCKNLYNTQIRDLLIGQIIEIERILELFVKNGNKARPVKKVDADIIISLEIIQKNIDNNINDQTNMFSQVKDVLNINQELQRMKNPQVPKGQTVVGIHT